MKYALAGFLEVSCYFRRYLTIHRRFVGAHPGIIVASIRLGQKQRALRTKGNRQKQEGQEIARALSRDRARLAAFHGEQVVNSMKELMPCIRGTNLAMGLENRYHDDEIPFLDELWALLDPCQQNLSRGLEVLGKAGCVFRL